MSVQQLRPQCPSVHQLCGPQSERTPHCGPEEPPQLLEPFLSGEGLLEEVSMQGQVEVCVGGQDSVRQGG